MVLLSGKLALAKLCILLIAPAYCMGQARHVKTVGHSGVSAQMAFLADSDHVVFIDKAENNPISINGHPAWVARYQLSSNDREPMDVRTNTFCAGGASAGDGRYVVSGGTAALGYTSLDGGFALNIYDPATNTWEQNKKGLQRNRWYPSLEPMADGSVIIVGGQGAGGYVPTEKTNEPTYEFYPSKGKPVYMDILARTVPLNLYPLIFLMSNGELFVQANRQASLWNLDTQKEKGLPRIPDVPRPYPASAGVAMLPMKADDGFKQTILFCGGITLGSKAAWGNLNGPGVDTTDKPASNSCQQIEPLGSATWSASDPLPEGRSMGMFIHLPDGTLLFVGGVKKGTAGYKSTGRGVGAPVGQSLGDDPSYTPLILDPLAPAGSKWRAYGRLAHARLYHSSALLLPDGAVMISGSNPNEDVSNVHWGTSYTVDKWYPPYYDSPRPSGSQLPSRFGYGGKAFEINLSAAMADIKANTIKSAYVRILRTGFSTHGINWGQRSLQLDGKMSADKSRLVVSGLPSNSNLFAPGPAMAFLVINGVPSTGKLVQIGPKGLPEAARISMTEMSNLQQVSPDVAEEAASSTGEGGKGKRATMEKKRCSENLGDKAMVGRDSPLTDFVGNVTLPEI